MQRLCATKAISDEQRQPLQLLRDQTNPRQVRREIYDLLDRLFSLPGAAADKTESALETLFIPLPVSKGEGSPVTLSFGRTITLR